MEVCHKLWHDRDEVHGNDCDNKQNNTLKPYKCKSGKDIDRPANTNKESDENEYPFNKI